MDGLDLVEIERVVAGDGTVESSFEKSCPVVFENETSASIALADSRNSRVDGFTAVDVLHGRLPEHEVDEVVGLKRPNEIRLSKPERVVLDGSEQIGKIRSGHPVDGVVVAREVGGAADEVVAVVGHECRAVGVG